MRSNARGEDRTSTFSVPKTAVLPLDDPRCRGRTPDCGSSAVGHLARQQFAPITGRAIGEGAASVLAAMGSLIKKRRKRMRKKKHKKMLKRTRLQRRAGQVAPLGGQVARQGAARCGRRPSPRRGSALDEPGRAAAGQHGLVAVASASPSRHSASRGSTARAAGSRSFGPARSARPGVPRPVDRGRRAAERRVSSVKVRSTNGSGSTTSPMPAPGPGHPPGRTARRPQRGRPRRVVDPAHRRTAAASADPPPRPAPAGMRLSSRTWAVRPTAPAPGAPGCRRRPARAGPTRPSTTSRPSPSVEGQLVGQVERHHLGVEQVVAVVPVTRR